MTSFSQSLSDSDYSQTLAEVAVTYRSYKHIVEGIPSHIWLRVPHLTALK